MKKLLALLLLFVIVGCVSTLESTGMLDSRNTTLGCNGWNGCRQSSHEVKTDYRNVEIQTDYDLVAYPKAEAINIETGKKYHFGHSVNPSSCVPSNVAYEHCPKLFVEDLCEDVFNSKCILSRSNDDIYFKDLDTYLESEKRNKEYRERLAELNDQAELEFIMEERQKQITYKQRQEEKKMAVIHALKDRCISYGFTGSNNIAACVQREAQHDYEIEQKEYELQLTRQQLLAQQNQQQVVPQVPWYLSILEGVAEGVAEGYKQKALIQTMDSRYEKKDIYRYCRPNC